MSLNHRRSIILAWACSIAAAVIVAWTADVGLQPDGTGGYFLALFSVASAILVSFSKADLTVTVIGLVLL